MSSPIRTIKEGLDNGPRLLACDFDGTQLLTSEKAEGILSVDQAYAAAIDGETTDPEAADRFLKEGGHRHNTPAEIVRSLYPDMELAEVETTAQKIVVAKLKVLTDQIGKPLPSGGVWPRPTEGFASLREAVVVHNQSSDEQQRVDLAVVSAGHQTFIEKAYDQHGIARPDIIVTDDYLVEELGHGETDPKDRAKPNPLLLEVTEGLWVDGLRIPEDVLYTKAFDTIIKSKMLYTGDSVEKDGGIAQNYGVPFELLDPNTSAETWARIGHVLNLGTIGLEGAVA